MNATQNPKSTNKIVAIGLDSADYYLIQKWTQEGRLPTIASLIQHGCFEKLGSSAEIGSGTVWPTFFTGMNPGKHFGNPARRLKSGTYTLEKEDLTVVLKKLPFWLILSQARKRVAVVDVPKTVPIHGMNGIQLMGWGAFAPNWPCTSLPSEVKREIVSRFGTYPAPNSQDFHSSGPTQLKELYESLMEGIEKKCQLLAYLLQKESWDLFLTVFAEPHWAGHFFWHLMEPQNPSYDPALAKTLGEAILKIYMSLDSSIEKLIEMNPDSNFFIFSTEGMGPNYTGSFLLPEVLQRLGMSGETGALRKLSPASRWGPYTINNIKDILPSGAIPILERAKRIVPLTLLKQCKSYLMQVGNNWRDCRAFCSPSDFNGAIRVNLKGREPRGLVEPGLEYNELCEELNHLLSQLINVDTGKRAVKEVIKVPDYYHGEYINEFPDLIVKWEGTVPIRGLSSSRIGTIRGENHHDRSGAHRSYGFLIATGPAITHGKSTYNATIMDLAPTILHLLGQSIPHDMDGKVLKEILAS